MGNDLNGYMGLHKILRSQAAESGAKDLLKKVEEEELLMEIIPNTFPEFTGEVEERDFQSYCSFLQNVTGRKIIALLEECDAEKYTEL